MDRWSTEQITRMEKGGNAKAREFFEQKFGSGYKGMSIPEKVCCFVCFILLLRWELMLFSMIRMLHWIIRIN